MTEEMEAKGINVNKESLATRVRNVRRIGSLEAAADANAKAALGGDNSDDEDQEIMDDDEVRNKEGEERGRKGRKDEEKKAKKMLGKRGRAGGDDEDMDSDDNEEDLEKIMDRNIRGSLGKDRKSMTPVQRKISVQKMVRDRTASRREGS